MELSENMLQNLFLNLPPQTVVINLKCHPVAAVSAVTLVRWNGFLKPKSALKLLLQRAREAALSPSQKINQFEVFIPLSVITRLPACLLVAAS